MMTQQRMLKRITHWLSLLLLCVSTQAVAEYPERTIRIVVPYPAGGATDTLARQIGKGLSDAWNTPVIIDNRPGASGITGANMVANARKDGYTIMMGIVAMSQLPALYKTLPFDVTEDFAPLTEVARSQNLLAVPKSLGVSTYEEFVALVKSQPDEHSFGSYGNGTSAHIYGEILKQQTGMDLVHIPYRGSAPLVTDLLGERLSLAIVDAGSIRSQLDTANFNIIAVTGSGRSSLVPDAPSLTELGLKHFESNGWFGLFAPAGVPADVLDKLVVESARIINSDDMATTMRGFGLTPVGSTRQEFSDVVSGDVKMWTEMIKITGIKLD